MNKTQIEWVKNPDGSQGYTWNPITGCLNHENGLCKGGGFPCYAYKLANGRLNQRHLANENIAPLSEGRKWIPMQDISDPFYPRFWEERLYHAWDGKPRGVFVCDMGDLFGIGIPEEWTNKVLNLCRLHEQNRYYLLTKQAKRLPLFSPFPDNCWVGVTATNRKMFCEAIRDLKEIKANTKYISIEPCLERVIVTKEYAGWIFKGGGWRYTVTDDFMMRLAGINWLIIGACTGTYAEMTRLCALKNMSHTDKRQYGNKWTLQPKIEWVREIVEAADRAGIKVFLKDNLDPLLRTIPTGLCDNYGHTLRQELPQ